MSKLQKEGVQMKIEAEIITLRAELREHAHRYYNATPTITDAEYDQKFRRLKELETKYPDFDDPNSPTKRVGSASVSSFAKVKHLEKMLSLDNTYNAGETFNFFPTAGVLGGIVCEPKIDGMSLTLHYKGGALVKAVTRGDGSVGDDVTANARTVKDIPLVLSQKWTGEIRGEIFMRFSVFNKLNAAATANGEDTFANPRNAANGSMKSKDSSEVAKRSLSFLGYYAAGDNPGLANPGTHEETLVLLRRLGVPVPDYVTIKLAATSIESYIQAFDAKRKTLDFPVDGAVFKINDLALRSQLGDGTRAPKWACAFKFPPERVVTRLLSIELSVGRLGTITPVANLKPIAISGATVSRASLCNFEEIARLDVNVGDDVYVERSAEVIPKVLGVANKLDNGVFPTPTACPSCGTAIARVENADGSEGVSYRCPNKSCKAQVFQRLKHAVSKGALDIDGCGDALITTLMEAGVSKLSDLFSVDPSSLKTAARKKFLSEREKAKNKPLWRKIYALGAESVGQSYSKDLEARYASIVEIAEAPEADLEKIMGKVATATFRKFLLDEAEEIEKLDALGLKFESNKAVGPLTGKTFVITGQLTTGSRGQVSEKIEKCGGTCKGSVSRKVDFLVVGEGGGDNKAEAAAKNGTKCITEEQLYAMMGTPMEVADDQLLDDE